MLFVLLTHAEALGVGWHDEAGLTATLELGLHRGDDYVNVGNAAVGDPCLGAVEHPLVGGLVVDSTGAQRRNIATGVWLADAECAELHIVGGAVTLGHPLHHLLRRAVARNTGGGESRTHDGHTDAGIAPEQFFDGHGQGEPSGIGHCVHQEIKAVETDLGGLLNDWPRELLGFVPLAGGGADHGYCEVVNPLLDLQLVVVERE